MGEWCVKMWVDDRSKGCVEVDQQRVVHIVGVVEDVDASFHLCHLRR